MTTCSGNPKTSCPCCTTSYMHKYLPRQGAYYAVIITLHCYHMVYLDVVSPDS